MMIELYDDTGLIYAVPNDKNINLSISGTDVLVTQYHEAVLTKLKITSSIVIKDDGEDVLVAKVVKP